MITRHERLPVFSKEASIVERPAFRAFARRDHRSGDVQADDRRKVQRIPTLRVAVALEPVFRVDAACRLAVSEARLALPNFYDIAIRIANVAARLAILVLWLCDKLGSSISP